MWTIKKIFSQFGLHSVTTEYDSSKMLIISHLVSLVAVPVNARTGTEGDKLICKETNLCKCRVSITMVRRITTTLMDKDSLSTPICYPNQLLWSSKIYRNLHIHKLRSHFDFKVIILLSSHCDNNISLTLEYKKEKGLKSNGESIVKLTFEYFLRFKILHWIHQFEFPRFNSSNWTTPVSCRSNYAVFSKRQHQTSRQGLIKQIHSEI